MDAYNELREHFRPAIIKVLFIAESPPPTASIQSSRQFYRAEKARHDDRLFTNTIKALYPEARNNTEPELEANKLNWLKRFKNDGFYMIEALKESQPHEATKQQRQQKIREALPRLLTDVKSLASSHTKIILIKSNVFIVAAEPLRHAGFNVLNQALVDYPGQYNQRAYREKVSKLLDIS